MQFYIVEVDGLATLKKNKKIQIRGAQHTAENQKSTIQKNL
jgi:hypothetical protein